MDDEPEGVEAGAAHRVGQTLGKYTLEKVLGVGGMASVYRGTHRNGNKVAVKVLHQELCASRDIRERFLREGYVANRVEHHGAVRVLDDESAPDGTVFLVMELLEGETLEDQIVSCGGTLSPREVVPLVVQLLEVLCAAHERGIVHRDIKPENLFIQRRDGSLKVLDFGIARLADGKRQATRTGRVLGTPAYMSPEQARGETKRVDGQTDVWAAGAVLFRALVGRTPHEAETAEMSMILSATQPVRPMKEVLAGTEPKLAALIDRALELNKDERWPTAQAMFAALRELNVSELSDGRFGAVPAGAAFDRTEAAPIDGTKLDAPTSAKSTLPSNGDAAGVSGPTPERATPHGPSTTAGTTRAAPATPSPASAGTPLSRNAVLAVLLSLAVVGTTVSLLSRPRGGESGVVMPLASPTPVPASASVAAGLTAPLAGSVVPGASAPPVEPPPALDAAADAPPVPVTPPKAGAPASSRPRAPAATVATVTPAPATPAPADCNPPYTLTAAGTRKYKPECVK